MAVEPHVQLSSRLLAKVRQGTDVLKRDGPLRLLELWTLALCEPVRSLRLRLAVAADARRIMRVIKTGKRQRGLFIDCGSNIGQGYKFFSTYYTPDFYDYILVEPNVNCMPYLKALSADGGARIEIIGKAAGVRQGYAKLFGPPAGQQEPVYEGCSINPEHNASYYEPEGFAPDLVETFSLSDLITAKRRAYDVVVLKMDIEGAEYDVLDDIIKNGAHRNIYVCYVEFHSIYMKKDERIKKRIAEREIGSSLTKDNVLFRRWI
ncbi:FkbM family methyltransferase [Phreatobacter stygius]|uniref:FkbM family methyltransferase n=2 Tax=Phreatobacter stygius TaxID=1940610 RepID=A0A4D7BIN1_9HYPH|nr:FkbM family methyltransferase [Phreatobacter stygius]